MSGETSRPDRTAQTPWWGRLCFVTCFDDGFIEGAKGTLRSIRRIYGAEEASIVVFAAADRYGLGDFCRAHDAELQLFAEIEQWALPLIYSNPAYRDDRSHYYHPDFVPDPALPCDDERTTLGFTTLRHLHPWHVKSYCTAYCLVVRHDEWVVYVDADAFLLWRVDELLATMIPNTVVGFEDGRDELPNLERLYGVRKPAGFDAATYALNGGVVFYRSGEGVRTLMLDFMHLSESCHHFMHSGSFCDQGLLRALVAKHHIQGNVDFELRDAVNWNPTRGRADHLRFVPATGEWINESNGRRQYIWHGAGLPKLWIGRYRSESVNAAWRFVGGDTLTRPFLILGTGASSK